MRVNGDTGNPGECEIEWNGIFCEGYHHAAKGSVDMEEEIMCTCNLCKICNRVNHAILGTTGDTDKTDRVPVDLFCRFL